MSSAWVRYVNMHVSRVTFTCTRTHEHVHKNKYLFQVYFGLFAHFMLIHPLLIYLCNWKNIVIKCLRSKKKKKSLHAQHNVSMSVCVCMCVRCVRACERARESVCLFTFFSRSVASSLNFSSDSLFIFSNLAISSASFARIFLSFASARAVATSPCMIRRGPNESVANGCTQKHLGYRHYVANHFCSTCTVDVHTSALSQPVAFQFLLPWRQCFPGCVCRGPSMDPQSFLKVPGTVLPEMLSAWQHASTQKPTDIDRHRRRFANSAFWRGRDSTSLVILSEISWTKDLPASPPSNGAVDKPRALNGVGQGLTACGLREEFWREYESGSWRRAEFCRELGTDSESSFRL